MSEKKLDIERRNSTGRGAIRSDFYGRFATGKCFDHNSSEDQAGGEGPPPLVFMPTMGALRLMDGRNRMSAGNPFASTSEGAGPNLETMGEVLITGGAGFLGRYLANALAASGNSVTVLDDLSCSNSTFDCAELQHERISCVRGSVFNRGLVNSLVAQHRTVVHFASVVGSRRPSPTSDGPSRI